MRYSALLRVREDALANSEQQRVPDKTQQFLLVAVLLTRYLEKNIEGVLASVSLQRSFQTAASCLENEAAAEKSAYAYIPSAIRLCYLFSKVYSSAE